MNAALIALGGIVGVLLLALFGILRDGKRREEAWDERFEPPADDHLWDVLRGGREHKGLHGSEFPAMPRPVGTDDE